MAKRRNANHWKAGSNKNQRSKFNAEKFGKLWNGIKFELMHGHKALEPIAPAEQPLIGSLVIGGKKFEITWSEANRIMDTLKDAQVQYNNAKRLGMLEAGAGTPVPVWSKTYE